VLDRAYTLYNIGLIPCITSGTYVILHRAHMSCYIGLIRTVYCSALRAAALVVLLIMCRTLYFTRLFSFVYRVLFVRTVCCTRYRSYS